MVDEYQIRKDIENLYNLLYNRTSNSPVAQKEEFDALKKDISTNYVKSADVDEIITVIRNSIQSFKSNVSEALNELDEDITTLEGRADTIDGQITTINGTINDFVTGDWTLRADTPNVTVRTRGKNVKVMFAFSTLTVLANSYNVVGDMNGAVPSMFFPAVNISKSAFNLTFQVSSDGYIRIFNPTSADITITNVADMIDYTI